MSYFERAVLYVYTSAGAEIYFTGTNNLGGESGDLKDVKTSLFYYCSKIIRKGV